MKVLKYYVSMSITWALIMGICTSAYAKGEQSKDKVSPTAVRGRDGNKQDVALNNQKSVVTVKAEGVTPSEKIPETVTNTKEVDGDKKDGAPDRNQDDVPVKAGSATPTGQMQATGQERMQGLKQVEELSVQMQEMRNSMQEIGSTQEELRKYVERFSLARKGVGLGDVSPFVGAIVVVLSLMVIVGVYGWLNWLTVNQLKDIKQNSRGGSFSDEQINKMTQKIVEVLPTSSGNAARTGTGGLSIGSIETIKATLTSTLSKELEKLANQHFGTKVASLDQSVPKIDKAVNTMTQSLSSVDMLKERSQQITSSADSLKRSVQEVIESLKTAMTNFTTDVKNATSSFCNAEAVSVLPRVQKLIEDLGGTLTKTNSELDAKVRQLKEGAEESKKIIADRDKEIQQLNDKIDAKDANLHTEQEKHQEDNTHNEEEICRLNGEIENLRGSLETEVAAKKAAQLSLADEKTRREGVEAEKGNLEGVIAKRDVWNQSLFPSWFEDPSLKSLHDTLCSEFVSESPSMECLLFRAALLELKAMELKGMPDGIESLLTRLGRYCFAYLSEKKCEMKDMFEFGKKIATLVSESDMVKPTGVYVRVPRMGGQVDLQWMRSPSNERTIQTIRTWSVWTNNGLSSRAEVN